MAIAVLDIYRITCYTPNESNGDEIYLKVNGGNAIYAGGHLHAEESAYFTHAADAFTSTSGEFRVDMWEDDPVWDDKLGTLVISAEPTNGLKYEPYAFEDAGADYGLFYSVYWLAN